MDRVELLMRAGGFAAAVAFALIPRRAAATVLPLGVATFLALSSYSVFGSIRDHSEATLGLTQASNPSWIDAEIGSNADAAFVYGTTPDLFGEAQIMWQVEFWNRSVGTIYNIGPPDPAMQTSEPTTATLDAQTGRFVPTGGSNPSADYVVARSNVNLRGTMLAQQGPFVLYRAQRPLQLASYVGGIDPDGWMGSFAALTRYVAPSRPGSLRVRVSREGWPGPSPPGKVTIQVGTFGKVNGQPGISAVTASRTWTVRSGTARTFSLPTPARPYRLEIRIEPTFSPADYGEGDIRQLGAQIQLQGGA